VNSPMKLTMVSVSHCATLFSFLSLRTSCHLGIRSSSQVRCAGVVQGCMSQKAENGDDKMAINAEQRPVIVISAAHGPTLWQRLPPPAKFIDIPTSLNTPEHPLHTPCLTSPNVNPARSRASSVSTHVCYLTFKILKKLCFRAQTMLPDPSLRSGRIIIFRFIRQPRPQPNTRLPKTSDTQESIWHVWDPAITSRTTALFPYFSPHHQNPPLLSPLAPPPNGPTPACVSGKTGVAPLHGVMQELIHHLRTSGTVLQTTLCYVETVRRKLPKIASAPVASVNETTPGGSSQGGKMAIPEPLVPSPLLCPRCTSLASLILASNFLQDRCYSNRAWAKLSGLSPHEVGRCEKAPGDAPEWRLWVGKQYGKPLVRSRSHADLSFGATNPCGTSSRTIGTSRTLPSIGTECSNAKTFPVALISPKLDPYQEWLILNQSCLEAEAEEPTPMAVERISVVPTIDVLTPATPPLVQSPASSISSAASIASFDLDGKRTIQMMDISEPLQQKPSGNLDKWFDSAAPAPNVAVCGVYNVKVFEYVELANSYHFLLDLLYFIFHFSRLFSSLFSRLDDSRLSPLWSTMYPDIPG